MKLSTTLFICSLVLVLQNPLISKQKPANAKKITLTKQSEAMFLNDFNQMISPNPFFISAEKVKEITQRYDVKVEELLQLLVPVASSYARPCISNYKVGIAALGKSGAIYLGVNLEFPGVPLNESVHGEQFAITNARSHGETELLMIALSAAPCGHCRQFMNEMVGEGVLQILTPNSSPVAYSTLLPEAFGPKDLGLSGNLLTLSAECDPASSKEDSCITSEALEAVLNSYAPYTNAQSGIALLTKDGKIYQGSYLENAAFNPSLSPLQAALVSLVADLRDYSEIQEALLFEKLEAPISQEVMSREILKNIAPEAIFYAEKLKV